MCHVSLWKASAAFFLTGVAIFNITMLLSYQEANNTELHYHFGHFIKGCSSQSKSKLLHGYVFVAGSCGVKLSLFIMSIKLSLCHLCLPEGGLHIFTVC